MEVPQLIIVYYQGFIKIRQGKSYDHTYGKYETCNHP